MGSELPWHQRRLDAARTLGKAEPIQRRPRRSSQDGLESAAAWRGGRPAGALIEADGRLPGLAGPVGWVDGFMDLFVNMSEHT